MLSYRVSNHKLIAENIKAFNYNDNKLNSIYTLLEKMKNFLFKISNININFFIEFEKFVYKFTLNINELNSDMKKENEEYVLNRNISLSTFSMSLTPYYNTDKEFVKNLLEDKKKFIELSKFKTAFYYMIISDISFKISILANKFRFEKSSMEFTETSMKEPQKIKYLNKLQSNSSFEIEFTKFEINFQEQVLSHLIQMFNSFKDLRQIKDSIRATARQKLMNTLQKIRNRSNYFSIDDNKGFSQPILLLDSIRKNRICKNLIYLIYIYLKLAVNKYIKTHNMNFYLLVYLLNYYKKFIREDYLLLNYLIEENINEFLDSPQVSDLTSAFMTMDYLKHAKTNSEARALRDFSYAILLKLNTIRPVIEDYSNHDDFFKIDLKLNSIVVNLNKHTKSLKDSRIEDGENVLISNLRFLRDSFHTQENNHVEFSNNLLKFEVDMTIVNVYCNKNFEYVFLRANIQSVYLWDLSYRNFSDEKMLRENYFPVLKIEYNIQFNFFKVQNNVTLIEADFPMIYTCIDPYFMCFMSIYYKRIKHVMKNLKLIENKIINSDHSTQEDPLIRKYYTQYEDTENNNLLFHSISLNFCRFIIHTSYTKIKTEKKNSMMACLNNIMFQFHKTSNNFLFKIDEVIIGSVENERVFDFINFKKNIDFKTTILNLFEINQAIDFNDLSKRKSLEIPLIQPIYMQLCKEDIHLIENYIFTFVTLAKFSPRYESSLNRMKPRLTGFRNLEKENEFTSTEFFENENQEEIADNTNIEENKADIKTGDAYKKTVYGLKKKIVSDNNLKLNGKHPNDLPDSDIKGFFFTLSIIKFVIQIKLESEEDAVITNQANTYKKTGILFKDKFYKNQKSEDLILVIDNFYFYKSTACNSEESELLITLQQLNIIHHSNKKEKKIIEIINRSIFKQLTYSDFLRYKDNKFENLSCFFYMLSDEQENIILSSLPPIYLGIDHMLISYLIKYFEITNNIFIAEFKQEAEKLINQLSKKDNDSIATGRYSLIAIKIIEINSEAIIDNTVFFSFATCEVKIDYIENLEKLEIHTHLKYLNDERLISSNNKHIIFNPKSFVKIDLEFEMSNRINTMHIIISNPVITLLLRQIMDVIEYAYFIFVRDIFGPKNQEEIFNQALQELREVEKENEEFLRSQGSSYADSKESIIFKQNDPMLIKDNDIDINFKVNNVTRRYKRINFLFPPNLLKNEEDKIEDVEDEDVIKPLTFKITVNSGEVLICMNSIKKEKINLRDYENSMKKEKLVLSFNKLEFCYLISDKELIENYLNYLKKFKFKEEKSFALENIDMYLKVKDAKLTINGIDNEFAWFVNKGDSQTITERSLQKRNSKLESNPLSSAFLESFTLLIHITEEFFSNVKIFLIIPYVKIKFFTDIYEKLLRVFFENLFEEQTILSECSKFSTKFFEKNVINKTYLEFAVIIEELIGSVYNFPMTCLSHRDNKNTILHGSNFSECKYSTNKPSIELDKMCTMKINKLYVLLRFNSNRIKNNYVEASNITCELNKHLKCFHNLNTYDLIIQKEDPDAMKSNTKELSPILTVDVMGLPDNTKEIDLDLKGFKLNLIQLPLIALQRFFGRFFLYYFNRNIKLILHDEIPIKILRLKMRDINLILSSPYLKEKSYEELDIKCNIDYYMMITGNTTLGPYKDLKQISIMIESIYLNNFKGGRKTSNNLNTNFYTQPSKARKSLLSKPTFSNEDSGVNVYRNQIVDSVDLDIEMYSEALINGQGDNRLYYLFGKIKDKEDYKSKKSVFNHDYCIRSEYVQFKYKDSVDNKSVYSKENQEIILENKNLSENNFNFNIDLNSCERISKQKEYHESVNIKKDDPHKYKEYIRNFIFKEQDIFNEHTESNQNDQVIESEHPNEKKQDNESKCDRKPIMISLNISLINQLLSIIEDSKTHLNKNYNSLLYFSGERSTYDRIKYDNYNGFYINEVQIQLSDSQFNTKLLQVTISNILSFITNSPNKEKLQKEEADLGKRYKILLNTRAHENNITNEICNIDNLFVQTQFDYLTKFLVKLNYFNNTNFSWEPFIEPMPIMMSYFKLNLNSYFLIDILSLQQISLGLENICRQKKFHSFNLNINETILETLRSVSLDTKRNQNNKSLQNEKNKKLFVKNLTEHIMEITNLSDFEEEPSEKEDLKILAYKKAKTMSLSNEILQVNFTSFLTKSETKNETENIRESHAERNMPTSTTKFIRKDTVQKPVINRNVIGNNISGNFAKVEENAKTKIEINMEKTSKLFTILQNETTKYSKSEEYEELKKKFDEKNFSILLSGEYLLVTEIDLSIEKNTKSVTFRSNEGIKNDLDFPVKIKFLFKEGINSNITNYYESSILINPKKVYFIPPLLLNQISEIKFRPIIKISNVKTSNFRSARYKPNQSDVSQDENNFTILFSTTKNLKRNSSQYFNYINFAVTKKLEVAENDLLDTNIKKRMEWIKSYSRFKKGKDESQKGIDIVLADVMYVLSPIVRFHNSLPRDIKISKMVPKDIESNKNQFSKEYVEIKFFDIDKFIKTYSELWLVGEKDEDKIINTLENYVSHKEGNFKDQLSKINEKIMDFRYNANYDANSDNVIKISSNGDYLSIYEPYPLIRKFAKNMKFKITVEDLSDRSFRRGSHTYNNSKYGSSSGERLIATKRADEANPDENNIKTKSSKYFKISKDKNDTEVESANLIFPEYLIYPFKFDVILKMTKNKSQDFYDGQNENSSVLNSLIGNLYPKDGRDVEKSYSSKNIKYNYCWLLYKFETTENKVINTHFFCPYLFMNSSDLDLQIEFKNSLIKRLPKILRKNTMKKFQTIVENPQSMNGILNRMVMFYPNDKRNFKFSIKENSKNEKKSVSILDISTGNGKIIEINKSNTKVKEFRRQNSIRITRTTTMKELREEASRFTHNNMDAYQSQIQNLMPVTLEEKASTISIQMLTLKNSLKLSKLIFVTPSIYVLNKTKREIFIYHFNTNSKGPTKFESIKPNAIIKFYNLIGFYKYIKLSFEAKFYPEDNTLYSGLIKLMPNNEFYVTLSHKEKEHSRTLLFIKIYQIHGFYYAVIKTKDSIDDYPYVIVNNLDINIRYKQKEYEIEEMKDIFEGNDEIKNNIKEYNLPGIKSNEALDSIYPNEINANKLSDIENIDGLYNNDSLKNIHHYTWDEPFMRSKKGENLLEIVFFGSMFKINPRDIHEESKFSNRIAKLSYKNQSVYENPIRKGTLRVEEGLESSEEYNYTLFDFALLLDHPSKDIKINFEFHDKDLNFFRKPDGRIVLHKNREYEMYCINDEETNVLAGKIYKLIEKSIEFAKSVSIKKYIKNKSIYIEIAKKNSYLKNKKKKSQTVFIGNIENICVSLMQKNVEFMYIWFNDISLSLVKSTSKMKKVTLTVKDYQIDHYLKDPYYPIILSPLCDKSTGKEDYNNIHIEISNLKSFSNFYQVDTIYVTFEGIDLRLEHKIFEKLGNFISAAKRIFFVQEENVDRRNEINNIITKIDKSQFVDEKEVMSLDNFLLIKQIVLSNIRLTFSLKFENINMFIEKTALQFLKPLIEELGLKILNMDTAIFHFLPFIRNNVFQSSGEFNKNMATFYFNQFESEFVKSLGGIGSITNLRLVENLNNNIMANLKLERNSLQRGKKSIDIKDLYKSGYENISLIVGGLFMLAFKMMSVVGRFFAYITFDIPYTQRRNHLINRSVKSLGSGIMLALELFLFSFLYIFKQFYLVPVKMHYQSRYFGIIISIFIILFGIVLKFLVGITDFLTKILESVAFTINDVLGDRVKRFARYQRKIIEERLKGYNSIDAFANTVYKNLDSESHNTALEDIKIALPGIKNERKRLIMLFTSNRIIVVDYEDYRFIPIYQIHFSECKLFCDSLQFQTEKLDNLSIVGKKLGFLTEGQNRYLYIYLDTIHKKWWRCRQKSFSMKIKLDEFPNDSVIARRYEQMIREIFEINTDNIILLK